MSVESWLQDLTSKLAALGVYDLKGLEIGLSVLNSEAGRASEGHYRECMQCAPWPTASFVCSEPLCQVLTDQALARHGSLKKSSSRVSSKAFAPKARDAGCLRCLCLDGYIYISLYIYLCCQRTSGLYMARCTSDASAQYKAWSLTRTKYKGAYIDNIELFMVAEL